MKIGIVSMGCPKNLVDSEVMLGLLEKEGYEVSDEIAESDLAIVNTCSFIRDAKEESIDMILELANLKKEGKLKKLIVAGCLPQRYREELTNELKEVDGFVGTNSIADIGRIVQETLNGEQVVRIGKERYLYDHDTPRYLIAPKHSVYIKIAEGCDNRCSYCIIPEIRGSYISRPMESIIEEAEKLIDAGAKELNLISQDTTSYGKDIYGGPVLNKLLRRLVKIDGIRWIRLLYTHPAHFTDELIETIASEPAICKYIDLPLQHINDDILARMGRKVTKDSILSLLKNLRERIEGLVLRTSFIVGFPGETEEAFKELLGFIEEIRFERLGVFAYSKEEGTLAYGFDSHIQEKTKHNRLKAVMELQRSISGQYNQSLLGKRFTVLVDEVDENDPHLYIARTYGDAPEVDGEVLVRSRRVCSKGEFLDVRVIDTYEYDLVAEAVHEFA